jgi:tryptophan 7-halogenase
MRNFWQCKRVVVLGGGTAGWLAALEMRRLFGAQTEVTLVESSEIGIIGAGEGSVPNILSALHRYGIDRDEFMRETQATYKLGISFEQWRKPERSDRFYHLFSTTRQALSLRDWNEAGTYPLAAALIQRGIPLDAYPDARRWIEAQASQIQVESHLNEAQSTEFAYHFDARLLAAYLKKTALARGIQWVDAIVKNVLRHGNGDIASLQTATSALIEGDFFIDASGMRRLLIGQTWSAKWRSFKSFLTLDRAQPFFLPLSSPAQGLAQLGSEKPVPLVTRAIAMRAGWMWVIPTQGRLGCGYVYSSAHISAEQAAAEAADYWQQAIEPIRQISFEAGQFEQVWLGNTMAIGLASGFVEPLEATSIGQTLNQLAYFGDLLLECQGCVPEHLIERFNTQVAAYWDGLLDFLLLHYESARRDSPYWCDVAQLARPAHYLDLLETYRHRTPRDVDFLGHAAGSGIMFGALSWMLMATPLGVIQPQACMTELQRLGAEQRSKVLEFLKALSPSPLSPSAQEDPQTCRFAPGPPRGMKKLGSGPAFSHEGFPRFGHGNQSKTSAVLSKT